MKSRFIATTLITTIFACFLPFSAAQAQMLPFGGLVTNSIPCTCPGSIGNLWIYFTPLWFGPIPATGALVYVPYASQLFAWFNIGVPGTYHLGSYVPGVQACWMLLPTTPPSCAPLPSAGVIYQVGTSKPF